jgi:hypothetical protein
VRRPSCPTTVGRRRYTDVRALTADRGAFIGRLAHPGLFEWAGPAQRRPGLAPLVHSHQRPGMSHGVARCAQPVLTDVLWGQSLWRRQCARRQWALPALDAAARTVPYNLYKVAYAEAMTLYANWRRGRFDVRKCVGHSGAVHAVSLSRSRLVTASHDGTVRVRVVGASDARPYTIPSRPCRCGSGVCARATP